MSEPVEATNAEKVRIPVEDPAALEAFLLDIWPDAPPDAIAVLVGLFTRQNKEIHRLAAALGELRRGRSGGESEKLGRDQLAMFALLAAAQNAEAPVGAALPPRDPPPERPKERPKRRPLRERYPKLPVREQLLTVDERTCAECGADKVCVGHDESEMLEYIPPSFFILLLRRERLACPAGCSGSVTVAPPADKPFDGGIPGPGLVADVVEQKIAQHMPINRVLQSWSRSGVDVPEATAYGWCKQAGMAAKVVAEAIRHRAIVEAHVASVDDTTVRILDRDAEKGRVIGHIWGCVGDGRYAAYFATKTWQAAEAWKFLGRRRKGWLQGDGYAGYAALATVPGTEVRLAGCWAHARRYFIKARDKGDRRADAFLVHIGALFAIEAQATADGVDPDVRLARRLEQSRPLLDQLVVEVNAVSAQAVPQSPLGRAITYLVNQRPLLRRFLEDGRLPLDNNAAERVLRPIAAGRKGWLFLGSKDAADAAANLFTVVGTAKLQGVDVRGYLKWLYSQLARRDWSVDQAGAALLPEHFAAL